MNILKFIICFVFLYFLNLPNDILVTNIITAEAILYKGWLFLGTTLNYPGVQTQSTVIFHEFQKPPACLLAAFI